MEIWTQWCMMLQYGIMLKAPDSKHSFNRNTYWRKGENLTNILEYAQSKLAHLFDIHIGLLCPFKLYLVGRVLRCLIWLRFRHLSIMAKDHITVTCKIVPIILGYILIRFVSMPSRCTLSSYGSIIFRY